MSLPSPPQAVKIYFNILLEAFFPFVALNPVVHHDTSLPTGLKFWEEKTVFLINHSTTRTEHLPGCGRSTPTGQCLVNLTEARVGLGRETSIEKMPHQMADRQVCGAFSWLIIDMGGPRPLWVTEEGSFFLDGLTLFPFFHL